MRRKWKLRWKIYIDSGIPITNICWCWCIWHCSLFLFHSSWRSWNYILKETYWSRLLCFLLQLQLQSAPAIVRILTKNTNILKLCWLHWTKPTWACRRGTRSWQTSCWCCSYRARTTTRSSWLTHSHSTAKPQMKRKKSQHCATLCSLYNRSVNLNTSFTLHDILYLIYPSKLWWEHFSMKISSILYIDCGFVSQLDWQSHLKMNVSSIVLWSCFVIALPGSRSLEFCSYVIFEK